MMAVTSTSSTPVAEALGMSHDVLIPGERAWLDEYAEVRRRTGFQTVHHVWLMPLARNLHGKGAPLLDGLAGDVLFKSTYVSDALLAEQDPALQSRLLWEGLKNNRLRANEFLRPEVAASFIDCSKDAFRSAMAPFSGHEAAVTLGKLHTRAARAIAPSPLWLFGPEIDVELPFLQPEVIRAGLRVPLASKTNGDFYRRMVAAADSRIAALRSTNDGGLPAPAGPRRQTSPESLKVLSEQIGSSAIVMNLLTPEARHSILEPSFPGRPGRQRRKLAMLHWASLFAHWLEHHESDLAPEDFRRRSLEPIKVLARTCRGATVH
ncbi:MULTISPECIES: hypothetical protein [Glycomyces]|uniref:Asparagine synthetase domain-containing protein n=2 Tax=Glycomyces TaxID=58113 RepID=A0A9X3PP72_9ACTN|nr:hypothetical protein [Glycomyces lechevalierae]MDA1387695.1 hypothetical protein [Glycomyces lechevalierae]MDR7338012.1 hypothetical protein [Glycomyces lechevalierae]